MGDRIIPQSSITGRKHRALWINLRGNHLTDKKEKLSQAKLS